MEVVPPEHVAEIRAPGGDVVGRGRLIHHREAVGRVRVYVLAAIAAGITRGHHHSDAFGGGLLPKRNIKLVGFALRQGFAISVAGAKHRDSLHVRRIPDDVGRSQIRAGRDAQTSAGDIVDRRVRSHRTGPLRIQIALCFAVRGAGRHANR